MDTREAVARAICREDGCVEDCDCPIWREYEYRADAAIAAHLKALAAEGYVVVPREPTMTMRNAGSGEFLHGAVPVEIYRAMIQAGEIP